MNILLAPVLGLRSIIQPALIIPAQGWVMDDRGQVTLVVYNSGVGASIRSPKSTGVCVPQ
ncbi:hypothetical protein Q5692_33185 [Microcoleus sp. C2C3]|uniref:hypothetical protein n=1 Tax=unclassified Microcoleus TaxID=2642155 RepID=UPI002FD49341